MNIWIFNPYEPLPQEGAVRLRYASLSEQLVEQGHAVTWWSADWSHAQKRRRSQPLLRGSKCSVLGSSFNSNEGQQQPRTGNKEQGTLDIQLIPVPAYRKNISLRRVWSHRAYARGIAKRADAYAAQHGKPDVILFSVPPMEAGSVALKLGKRYGAKVVLDVMDAWPDTLRLAFMGPSEASVPSAATRPDAERTGTSKGGKWSSDRVYPGTGQDRIEYISKSRDKPARYRECGSDRLYAGIKEDRIEGTGESRDKGLLRQLPDTPAQEPARYASTTETIDTAGSSAGTGTKRQVAKNLLSSVLCPLSSVFLYPYTRLMRRYCREADAVCAQSRAFVAHARKYGAVGEIPVFHLAAEKVRGQPSTGSGSLREKSGVRALKSEVRCEESGTKNQEPRTSEPQPLLRLLYLGSMGRVYDLETLVQAVIRLREAGLGSPGRQSGEPPVEGLDLQLDLVGEGEQRKVLEALVADAGAADGITFHGYLEGEALDTVMRGADFGIIPMHPESGVAIPYKAAHYLSYGLPVVSSLPGELDEMLREHQCGVRYVAGDLDSLCSAIREVLSQQTDRCVSRENARRLFGSSFERIAVHREMAEWVCFG